MKPLRMVLAVAVVLSVVGVALCQERPAQPTRVSGTFVKVNLIVKARQRGEEATKDVTVTADDKTVVTVDAEKAELGDLKPEMRVLMITMVQGSTDKAARVSATSKGVTGSVVKVDGKKVVLRVRQRGEEAKEVTVATDKDTKILLLQRGEGGTLAEPKVGTLADVKAGMRVTAIPETGTAKKLLVSPARRRSGSRGGSGGQN